MNMARGVLKSDYNQGKQVLDKSVSYMGGAIHIYSLTVMARDENFWPTSTPPRLGTCCDVFIGMPNFIN